MNERTQVSIETPQGVSIEVTVVVPDAAPGEQVKVVRVERDATVEEAVKARDEISEDKVGELGRVGIAVSGKEVEADAQVEDKATVTVARKPVRNG